MPCGHAAAIVAVLAPPAAAACGRPAARSAFAEPRLRGGLATASPSSLIPGRSPPPSQPGAPLAHLRHALVRAAAALVLLPLAMAGCAGGSALGGEARAARPAAPPPGFTADTFGRE